MTATPMSPPSAADVPYRPIRLAARAAAWDRCPDGTLLLRSLGEAPPGQTNFGDYLRHWAVSDPDRPFLRQRIGAWQPGAPLRPWRSLSYGEAFARAQAIAQALLDRVLGPERPVLILSGNSIEQALLTLAGMMCGVPVAPVSPAYSLLSADLGKIRHLAKLLTPGMVFAQSGTEYARALHLLAALPDAPPELVVVEDAPADLPATTGFDSLLRTAPGPALDRAWDAVGPDTIAKFLLTSGSTGTPKAVPNTHGMLCANQAMLDWALPPDPAHPPVLLDWLPWNHTFGGNLTLNTVVRRGGLLHIDDGRPLPDRFAETLENLVEVSPTQYANVPVGYGMLADALERNPALAERFFRDLQHMFYGGAGLPQSVWDRLQACAVRTIGQRIVFMTAFGSTETAPIATLLHWPVDGPGRVGLPLPGVTVKLVPQDGRHELRLKGPIVFPGYHRQPELTRAVFDEDGFYRIGDAARLVDPNDPAEGIQPDGRLVEDFKLQTGSFVPVGRLRMALLSEVPELQDAVIAGHDRPYVAVLAWPNLEACRRIAGKPDAGMAELAGDARLHARLQERLRDFTAGATGSSLRVQRLMLLSEPASSDANEITDKGYVNQRAVLQRRADAVESLYAEPPAPNVVSLLPAVAAAAG
ncbi:feruloyl-CoA synthase [Marinibaculum pumilum]|uniref:Feruloyl-CoA synthase n=1 Tax=Marinibaculum pumilum TaxID=1766165 RepID=A0ABV7LAV0_9PROT